jgi:hypothetical protein
MAMQQNSDAIEEFGEIMESYYDVVDYGRRETYTAWTFLYDDKSTARVSGGQL